jgi:hypothetical protein
LPREIQIIDAHGRDGLSTTAHRAVATAHQ